MACKLVIHGCFFMHFAAGCGACADSSSKHANYAGCRCAGLGDRPRCSVSIRCWECTGQPGCPQLTGCRQSPCCSTVESSVHHTADHKFQGASTVSACCGACVMDQSSDAVQAAVCPRVVCGFEQRDVHVPGHVAESCCSLGCAAEDAAASTCRSVTAAGQCSESVMAVLPQC
jgi:hypothetical protein